MLCGMIPLESIGATVLNAKLTLEIIFSAYLGGAEMAVLESICV